MYTGSGPRITTKRLPASPLSAATRTDTGTSARSSTPSVCRPREIRNVRSAPDTTASTTSLTVPPNVSLTVLKSSRRQLIPKKRLCGPMGTFSGVSGAGLSAAQTTSPMPSAASRARASACSGCVSPSIAPSAKAKPARTAPRSPAPISSAVLGSRCGCHGLPECRSGGGSGETSKSTVARSTPAMPSMTE